MRPFWNSVRVGIYACMPQSKTEKKKIFEVTRQDIKQPIGIKATIMLEIKFQKHIN